VPPFWKTTVPVVVGLVLFGVQVIPFPERQYEDCSPVSVWTVLPEVVYPPLVCGSTDSDPSPPVCWTVAAQVHPPPVALEQSTEE
jgi:hypothetical protein